LGEETPLDEELHPEHIEEFLLTHCCSVARLSSRETRSVWHAWFAAFPLPEKQPHVVLGDSLVRRLLDVTRRLNGRNAIQAFREQDSRSLVVLTLETLAGWHCQCEAVPSLETLVADIIVTTFNYSWVLAIAGKSERYSDLLRYVYVDASCFPDDQK
jgi:hypothetical protein